MRFFSLLFIASIAQLGERKTEDLKVTGSIPVRGTSFSPRIQPNLIFFQFWLLFRELVVTLLAWNI